MSRDPSIPGLSRAAPAGVLNYLLLNLPQLVSILSYAPFATIPAPTSANFMLADNEKVPDLPFWVSVISGDDDGNEISTTQIYACSTDVLGMQCVYRGTIRIYVHPDTVYSADPATQQASRQTLLSAIEDWLRLDVFNTAANSHGDDGRQIPLASRELNPAGDTLYAGTPDRAGAFITAFTHGTAAKSGAGTDVVPCAEAQFTGFIQ